MQVLINFLSNSLKFSEKNSEILVNLRLLEKQFVNGLEEMNNEIVIQN